MLSALFYFSGFALFAQDSIKSDLSINVAYFNSNNQYQYLLATAKTKVDGKFQGVSDIALKFYIDSESAGNLLGSSITDHSGSAMLYIPASAQTGFVKSAKQSFIVVADESKQYNSAQGDVDITKAKLKMDTASDKQIIVTLTELKDTVWTPVKDVDVKVAVQRFGGDLDVNADEKTYTTDANGTVHAVFQRDGLPAGDDKGNLILVASVEDNDDYGNLSVQQTVNWGTPTVYISAYDDKTLFARRGQSPLWLQLGIYGIIAAVWSVLIYLVFLIRKIRKLGRE